MKNLFILLLFVFVGSETVDETVTWNETNKLTWTDFKGSPNLDSDAVALTASGITFGYSVKTAGERIASFTTTVEAHFYPNKSWYKEDKSNEEILAHEQLHFDITELYARKFRKQLTKLVVNQNVKIQMNRLHNTINKAVKETQRRYDKETKHSVNTEMQKEWEATIEKELQSLDAFKS